MNIQRMQQSRRKQICSERLQLPAKNDPKPEISDEELDRRALEMLERPKVKGAGQ